MKILLYISIIVFSFSSFSQDNSTKFNREKWKELKGKIKYKKSTSNEKSYNDSYSSSENSDGEYEERSEGNRGNKSYRERRHGSYKSDTKREEDSDNSANWDGFGGTAQVLMIVIAIFLIGLILYQLFFKNKSIASENTEIKEEQEEFDINTIEKSELEIALEKALKDEDFRKCIRIYFVFILKELSNNQLIDWERDKTNNDYLRELIRKKEFHGFRNSVDIFEIIWYGKREINHEIYQQVEPSFKNYLKEITRE